MKVTKITTILSKHYNIVCKTYEDGSTAIESNLMDDLDDEDIELSASFDAIESLILSQYSAGIKVGSPAYAEAFDTTIETILNNLD